MPPRRLEEPPRDRLVRFTFDGRMIEAPEGEPLAVAVLASGQRVLSRSFRFHRPRGLMCSTGQCGWCECEVDGLPSVRSCRVPVRDGLVARGEHAFPDVRLDAFGVLDAFASLVPPTFYHHRFLRPRQLRKRYLDVIRRFGGRGRLPIGRIFSGGTSTVRRTVDVLVVGAGRSGQAAAREAAGRGDRVLLVDASSGASPSDGLPEGVEVLTGTTVVGRYEEYWAAVGPEAAWEIRATRTVLATGCHEQLPTATGNDRPGVMGARTVERLVRDHGVVPGEPIALVGNVDDEAIRSLAATLEAAGVATVGPIPAASVRRIHGRSQVTQIEWTDGPRRRSARVEVVAVADRVPSLELLHAAGGTAATDVTVVGSAAAPARRPAALSPAAAVVCFCEDVRAGEIADEVEAGWRDPELLKRRTGALTGPCQGKYCAAAFAAAVGADLASLPTTRPPARPLRLGDLVTREEAAEEVAAPARGRPA